MRVISVNVGVPRTIDSGSRRIQTAIFKHAVTGRVAVRTLNIDGDRQADLRVHGGRDKAVYAYPHEHYAFWRGELPDADLSYGAFGENLTTEGLLETAISSGDRIEIGTTLFRVTVPRMPCFKLAARFGRADMVRRFWLSGRCGFYLAVEREGQIASGDEIAVTGRVNGAPSISDVFAARAARSADSE